MTGLHIRSMARVSTNRTWRFNCEIRESTAVDGRSMVIALEVGRGGKCGNSAARNST